MPKTLCTISTAALCPALLAGCAGTPPAGDHYVAPPLGASWTMVQHNTGSFGNGEVRSDFTRAEQTWQGQALAASRSAQGGTLFDPADGHWVALLDGGGRPVGRFEPPLGYTWPMKVGNASTVSYTWTQLATGRVTAFDNHCRVADFGDVSVPAGSFKAFRVECDNTLDESHIYWFSPELGINIKSSLRRGPASASGVGTRDTELVAQAIR